MPTLDPKRPTEIKKYTFDLTPWLDDQSLTISSVSSVTADSGLTKESHSLDSANKKITALLSGGTAGVEYKLTATFVTSDSQTWVVAIIVPVRNVVG